MQPLLVIMGVTASGKSTVGELLATELGIPFADADDLHSPENISKMAAGHPLNDDDRWPWLRRVGTALRQAEPGGLVMACSALKRKYRKILLDEAPRTVFVFLDGPRELLEKRLRNRPDHFMAPDMLDSQLDALEPLGEEEPGFTVPIDRSAAETVVDIRSKLAAL